MDLKSANSKTYYELLGVAKQATTQEIRSNYHELARVYHPDSNFYADIVCEKVSAEQVELFKIITSAYQTLIDPTKRQQYDQSIAPLMDERIQIWDGEKDAFWGQQAGGSSDMSSKRVRAPTFGKTGIKPFKSNVTVTSPKINLKGSNITKIPKRPAPLPNRKKSNSNSKSLVFAISGIIVGIALIGFAKFSKIKEIFAPSQINNQIQAPSPAEWKNKLNG